MKKRLYRSKTDKKLCGVCAGVADYFGIDPTIVRVIWALLAFFYGTSILLYVIMALVVPEQPAGGGQRGPRAEREEGKIQGSRDRLSGTPQNTGR